MKFKVSKKSFRHEEVYRIGYCKLQWLLASADPIAYSSGKYGWACDYYKFGNIYISTGYSPIGKQVDDKIVKHFDKLARKTYNNQSGFTEKTTRNFIKEIHQEDYTKIVN